ncbi:MAG TPA: polyphenol oxidase family protein [Candidatus Acidoferrales bacterium]|nr:polyphenol oxidase family protein [Candidatus Acidoferrales bacterium]
MTVRAETLIRAPILEELGLVAGFTTRAWGSMAGSHHPLDEQARNRSALANALGFDEVVRVRQVHGRDVVRVERLVDPWPVADAMWTDRAGVLLGIAAADCVPILVASRDGVVAGAPAGWEGTSRQVATALVGSLAAAGVSPEELVAWLGPSIGPCCYTVDDERAAVVASRIGDAALVPHAGRVVFDLWEANAKQLRDAGVSRIAIAGVCTRSGGADVWSYRGRGADGKYGTQLGFIGRRRS